MRSLIAEILADVGLPTDWEYREALMAALARLVADPEVEAAAERVRQGTDDGQQTRRAGRPRTWTAERVAPLRALRAGGMSYTAIGRRVGVSGNAVYAALKGVAADAALGRGTDEERAGPMRVHPGRPGARGSGLRDHGGVGGG